MIFCAARKLSYIFYFLEVRIMRIILDTDKKTITVPWNYAKKIDEMNKIVAESGAENAIKWDFKNYIQQAWEHAMNNTDKCLIVAQKPERKK